MGTSRFAIAAILLTLAGCERLDPLAVVEQPGGDHLFYQELAGDDEQFVCVLPKGQTLCEWEEADVIVHSMDAVSDLQVEWLDDGSLQVSVASGVVARNNPVSRDGEVTIIVRRI